LSDSDDMIHPPLCCYHPWSTGVPPTCKHCGAECSDCARRPICRGLTPMDHKRCRDPISPKDPLERA